jgi:glutathione reductase (NADPH)
MRPRAHPESRSSDGPSAASRRSRLVKAAFDLVVVGTGEAGASAAFLCRAAGWRVAIVDKRPFGGTCALRGCDPKKVLVGMAELVDWAERMQGSGIEGSVYIDWAALMRFKRSFTDPVPAQRENAFIEAGIETFHGIARFIDRTTIAVSDHVLESRYIVVAAGAKPARLHITGEEHLITSEDFLELETLPKRIAFVGGGYIALEFAHVAARAGAAPIVFQRGPRVLAGFEPELVTLLTEISTSAGIDVRVDAAVGAIEKVGDGLRVRGICGGVEFVEDCDLVVHAAGRVADVDDLALDVGGVERTSKGVAVNEFLQSTSNPSVYSAGDSADGGGLPLTPTAAAQGEALGCNLIDGNRHTVDYTGLASIVYTIPALGMTGLTQDQARQRNLHFSVRSGDSTQWYSSRRVRARGSAYRILVEDGSRAILGAHFLGPNVEELVNVFAIAIRLKVAADELSKVLFAYPTASSDVGSMLE